jgi:hypothetical protein
MKKCKVCQQEKALVDFYPHKAMKDGHLNICKSCVKVRVKKHRNENLEQIRAYDRIRGRSEKRREKNRVYCREKRQMLAHYSSEWRKRNRQKANAHGRVNKAIKAGKLIKMPCEKCGSLNVHGHHDDYMKPLEVRWLCPKHHGEQHRIYKDL